MARDNPSCVMTLDRVDSIIDRVMANKPVNPVDVWNTGLVGGNMWSYVRDRWGGGRGASRRSGSLESKITKISREIEVTNNPQAIWCIRQRYSYYGAPVCYLLGGESASNRAMAWALYGWLCADSETNGGRKTTGPDDLDARVVSMGGQDEILRRMSSLVKDIENRLQQRESDARKAIAEAKGLRMKLNAIKINVIGALDAQIASAG